MFEFKLLAPGARFLPRYHTGTSHSSLKTNSVSEANKHKNFTLVATWIRRTAKWKLPNGRRFHVIDPQC